jgi:hypothetical protein
LGTKGRSRSICSSASQNRSLIPVSSQSLNQIATLTPIGPDPRRPGRRDLPDPEQSGYRRDRARLKQLLGDVENGRVDIVVCEALDRLARDAEDVA